MSYIEKFLSGLRQTDNDVKMTLTDETQDTMDTMVVLSDNKNLRGLKMSKEEYEKKLDKRLSEITEKIDNIEQVREDKREKYSKESNMLNVLSGDVGMGDYLLDKAGLKEKFKSGKSKLADKFQSFKDRTGIQATQDNLNELSDKGIFRYVRDKKLDKRIASETNDEAVEKLKQEVEHINSAKTNMNPNESFNKSAPLEMSEVLKALSQNDNETLKDLEKIGFDDIKIPSQLLNENDVKMLLGSSKDSAEALQEMSKILKKMQEAMIDEQNTSIDFKKKEPTKTSKSDGNKFDKNRPEVKSVWGDDDDDDDSSLLEWLAGSAGAAWLCKKFPDKCKKFGRLLGMDIGDKDKKKKKGKGKKGKGGRFSTFTGTDKDKKKKSKSSRRGGIKLNTVLDGPDERKKLENKSGKTQKNNSTYFEDKKKENDKKINDKKVDESESKSKKKTKKSSTSKLIKKGGKWGLIAGGAAMLYDSVSSFFSDDEESSPKSVSSSPNVPKNDMPMISGNVTDNINVGKNVNMGGLDDDVKHNFKGLAKDYHEQTGDKFRVTSAFRDAGYQKQLFDKKMSEIKKQNPQMSDSEAYNATRRWVAPPGNSMHNYGLALDIDYKSGAQLTKAESLGLLDKWNFTRPLSHEPWHLEADGIDRRSIRQEGKEAIAKGEDFNPVVAKMGAETESMSTDAMIGTAAGVGALGIGTKSMTSNTALKPNVDTDTRKSSDGMKSKDIDTPDTKESGLKKGLKGVAKKAGLLGTLFGVVSGVSDFMGSENDSERKDTVSSMVGSSGGALAGGALGAALGSVVPGAGTVIGGLVGSIAGSIVGEEAVMSLANRFKDGDDFVHDDLKNKSALEKKNYLVNEMIPQLEANGDTSSISKINDYINNELNPEIEAQKNLNRKQDIYGTGDVDTPMIKKGDSFDSYNQFSQEFKELSKDGQKQTLALAMDSGDKDLENYVKQYNNEVKERQKTLPEFNNKIAPIQNNMLGSTVNTPDMMVDKKGSMNSNIQINNSTKSLAEKTGKQESNQQPIYANVSTGTTVDKVKTEEVVRLSDYSNQDSIEPLLGFVMSNR